MQGGCGAELEAQARARYVERDYRAAIGTWERAYVGYREESDAVGAARMAGTLAGMHGQINGDAALLNAWLGRARTLLALTPDSAEAGWVALHTGVFETERPRPAARPDPRQPSGHGRVR